MSDVTSVPELRRLLDTKAEAEAAWSALMPGDDRGMVWTRYESAVAHLRAALTDATLHTVLTALEAGQRWRQYVTDNNLEVTVWGAPILAALAPLFPESLCDSHPSPERIQDDRA